MSPNLKAKKSKKVTSRAKSTPINNSKKKKSDQIKREIDQKFLEISKVPNQRIFCESLQECSTNLLDYIGYNFLTEKLKQKINTSISNFSYLLKASLLESLRLAISIFGIVAFSVPSLEKIYIKGKDIYTSLYKTIRSVSSKIKNNFVNHVSKIDKLNLPEVLKSIKDIISNHKLLISISTICLVLVSIKMCQLINFNDGIKKFNTQISFTPILVNNLNFFPFNISLGKIIISHTGMFIDNSRELLNKIIEPINQVCVFRINNLKNKSLSLEFKKDYFNYQLFPIRYMVFNYLEQHGIFLYYFPGSGKSLTSLGIAQNLGLETIIICPTNIYDQWSNLYVKKYSPYLPKTKVLKLSEAQTYLSSKSDMWFNNKTLILDEAHNILFLEKTKKLALTRLLSRFSKRIILSATPIVSRINDFSYIINITAGKKIIPLDEGEFRREFFTIPKMNKIIVFNLVPILRIFLKLAVSVFQIPILEKVNEIQKKLFLETYTRIFGSKDSTQKSGFINSILSLQLVEKIRNLVGNFGGLLCSFREKVKSLAYQDTGGLKNEFILFLVVLLICLFISLILRNKYSDKNYNSGIMKDHEDYFNIDFKKISQKTKGYISFYNPKNDINNSFPIENHLTHFCFFNDLQYELFYKFQFRKLNVNDYLRLGITTKENLDNFYFEQEELDNFIKWGKFIGTTCFFSYQGKFDETFKISDDILEYNGSSYYLKTHYTFYKVPSKFEKVEDILKSNTPERVIIYSGSSLHSKYLSCYLNLKKIRHLYLNNGDNYTEISSEIAKKIIILDNSYYEGTSFLGVDKFIVLENESNFAKHIQIMGRCSRANSHRKGKQLNIYSLVSKTTFQNLMLERLLELFDMKDGLNFKKYKKDLKYRKYDFIFNLVEKEPESLMLENPDCLNYESMTIKSNLHRRFIEGIKETAIENMKEKSPKKSINCQIKNIYEKSQCGQIILQDLK